MKLQTHTTKKQSLFVQGFINKITGLFLLAFTCIACAGLSPAQTTSPFSNQQQSPEEQRLRDEWRVAMAQVPLPGKGCFKSEYPSQVWNQVGCVAAPNRPFVPKLSPRPMIAGNGNDISAQAPSGFISFAQGSFDSVTGVVSETGQVGGVGGQVANAYSLQLNTDFFHSTACAGTGNVAQCRGWEQFIYATDGSSGFSGTFIQYWILYYDNTCPGGWNTYPVGVHTFCYENSSANWLMGNEVIGKLGLLSVSGTATGAGDSVSMSDGSTTWSVSGLNAVNAAAGWTMAEYNVIGDGGGGQANFNNGSKIVTRERIIYGGNAPPNCVAIGFTGETNNLDFSLSPPAAPPGPAVIFSESSAGSASANCAAATSVGDTHLDTVMGLHYDFQAQGDFVVADTPDFVVEERQVSGAPNWPNAALNRAVATQMGADAVAVCGNPFGSALLIVNGDNVYLEDGHVFSTANGLDIWRMGNVYNITDQNGNSVNATDNVLYLNVAIGLGQWPAGVTGLIANANGNVHQLGIQGGGVLTAPFFFGRFYSRYGDSWRLWDQSLLSVCGEQLEPSNPVAPFYAKDLPQELYQYARGVCTNAGVQGNELLDDCTLDVAVIGDDSAANVFVNARQPVAEGYITNPKPCVRDVCPIP